jgi:multimeric flavodoxin WrbA
LPTAIAINCSLKPSGSEPSSTDRLIGEIIAALADAGVTTNETIRIADHDVKTGVEADMGAGDAWPAIRDRILDADILIFGTPIWLGHLSSVGQRVLERLGAMFQEIDAKGRTPATSRIAVAAIVGNEDGAHHVAASLMQGLNDVGFTIPASGAVYWVGEAMHKIDYKDLAETPEKTAGATRTLAANAAHLARLLGADKYPGVA